ncbi:MAG: hypothetical protein O2895_00750 [Chloroflexi bacterium]|nr:hypothetical protein [Chloroflexota bacterium]
MASRTLALAIAAIVLLIAACDDDDEDPTLAATSTGTATATAAARTPTATAIGTPAATGTGIPVPPPDDFSRGVPLGRQTGGATCDFLFPDIERPVVGDGVADVFVCIDEPKPGASVADSVEVRGLSAGSFEQNVVIELRDAGGNVVARAAATANAPDLGLFVGEWATTLAVPANADLAGSTLSAYAEDARDGSVAFGGEIALGGSP